MWEAVLVTVVEARKTWEGPGFTTINADRQACCGFSEAGAGYGSTYSAVTQGRAYSFQRWGCTRQRNNQRWGAGLPRSSAWETEYLGLDEASGELS